MSCNIRYVWTNQNASRSACLKNAKLHLLSWCVAPHRCGFLTCQLRRKYSYQDTVLYCASLGIAVLPLLYTCLDFLKTKAEQHGQHGRSFLFIHPDVRKSIPVFGIYKPAPSCSIVRSFNTFTAIVDLSRFNNSCLKSPASTLVDLTFQSRALRSFSLNHLRNLSL